jgi:transcriptional regulator with XRE-family HTH domain
MDSDAPLNPDASAFAEAIDANIARNLKTARERAGWSQTELAEKLTAVGVSGFHQTTIARIESGKRPLRAAEAIALSRLLETRVEDLAESTEMASLRSSTSSIHDARLKLSAAAEQLTFARWMLARELDQRLPIAGVDTWERYRDKVIALNLQPWFVDWADELLIYNSNPLEVLDQSLGGEKRRWADGAQVTPWVTTRANILHGELMTTGWDGTIVNWFDDEDDDAFRARFRKFGEAL